MRSVPLQGVYALLAYMPFHVFVAQSASVLTGGLDVWKAAKDVLTMALLAVLFIWVLRRGAYKGTAYLWFASLAVGYLLLHWLLYAVYRDTSLGVAALATVYNNRLLWFFGIGLSVALLWGARLPLRRIVKVVLVVSTIVCALGVLQYFLPKDLLTHVGYSLERGARPMFFIDDKPDLPRIMSTLRDPNSLGAYLLLPITLLTYYWCKIPRRRILITGMLLLHGLALLLTFSRSAWLAMVVSAAVLLSLLYGRVAFLYARRYALLALAVALFLAGGFYVLRDHYIVQNVIVHSDESTVQAGSNDLHWQLVREGAKGALAQPQGHGPGTAGIVSIQNRDGGVLTENYYVQLAYEVGLLGVALFIAFQVLVYRGLHGRRDGLPLALLATFWGYVVTNNLLHTWTNEAVALQWWLLAGLALGASRDARAPAKTHRQERAHSRK